MTLSPLARKLFIKPNQRILILNAPDFYADALEPLPDGTVIHTAPDGGGTYDAVHWFVRSAAEVSEQAETALCSQKYDAYFWTAWPKTNAKQKRDLTRDIGWEPLEQAGYDRVASVSISDDWSALRWRSIATQGK